MTVIVETRVAGRRKPIIRLLQAPEREVQDAASSASSHRPQVLGSRPAVSQMQSRFRLTTRGCKRRN